MRLAEVQRWVGAPPVETASYQRTHGELLETAWRDTLAGSSGWWWAVTLGDRLLALGFTAGDELDRGRAVRAALIKHLQPGTVAS